ncbi:hypothetical protein EDC04DRAFT_2893519 [Pisolithus marmoratus]|nr:hypothetical protein EDC04DRAFT_2893519 [Pisolithus marmoratus]
MEYDDHDDEPSLYDHRSDPQTSCVMDELSDEQTNNQLSKCICHDLAHGSPSLSLDVLTTACDYSTPFKSELVAKREDENSSPSVKALVINNMSKGWPKAANYESDVQAILETAIEIYCVILLTENPFPTSVQEVDWAKKAWTLACHHHNTELTHDGGILKLIMAWSTHICGQFKSKACPIVATSFGFKMSADKGVQTKNHLLVKLHANPTFPRCGALLWMNIKNKSDDAIKWEKYYNLFPRVAFALVLMVIECAIDEWASSSHEMITFREDDYSSVFGSHLASLNEFNQAAGELDLLKKLLEQVYSNGCTHTSITVKNINDQKKAILTHMFLNAIHDYQMGENTDSY